MMIFGSLFGGRGSGNGGDRVGAGDRAEGQRLFELGMQAAVQFRSNEAIELYTRSIAAFPNPSPYMNRANLLMKRIRCWEALEDLTEAKRLDDRQGRQFGNELTREIGWARTLAANYDNGIREKLVGDLRSSDRDTVAERIICASFGIDKLQWDYNSFSRELIEYHLFNDVDDIAKFDDVRAYPEAADLIRDYDPRFIEHKVSSCPNQQAYQDAQTKMHNFLCSYDLADMILLRRYMVYRIHAKLLAQDFGDFYDALDSDCTGVLREAEEKFPGRARGTALWRAIDEASREA